jgi:hypothetical protein
MSGVDEAKGLLTQRNNGSSRYQMSSGDTGSIYKMMEDADPTYVRPSKQDTQYRVGGGKRLTWKDGEAVIEDIKHRSYQPDSVSEIGFKAVSSTGLEHTNREDIQDSSVVTVDGLQATAKSLWDAGLLTKDAQGHYQLNNQKKL